MALRKEDKIITAFVNSKQLDKMLKVRAMMEGKEKSQLMREAVEVYFEKYPLSEKEKVVVENDQ